MKKLPSIWETERMKMQEITEADTDFIVELRSNPEAYRYFLAPHPLQKQEHIFWYRDRYLNDDFQSSYIARSKSEKTSLGVFSVKQTEAGEIEISYILAPKGPCHGGRTGTGMLVQKIYRCCCFYCTDTYLQHAVNKANKPTGLCAERAHRGLYIVSEGNTKGAVNALYSR